MKTIIVYYSLEGNTEYAAKEAAARLGADLLRIYPKKAYPSSGLRKFYWGGKSSVMAEAPELEPYSFDADAYGHVILAFPVWASSFAPPIRSFIRENDLSGKRLAAIACQSGSGAEKAFAKLRKALGTEAFEAELILTDPKARPSEADAALIDGFCAKLS